MYFEAYWPFYMALSLWEDSIIFSSWIQPASFSYWQSSDLRSKWSWHEHSISTLLEHSPSTWSQTRGQDLTTCAGLAHWQCFSNRLAAQVFYLQCCFLNCHGWKYRKNMIRVLVRDIWFTFPLLKAQHADWFALALILLNYTQLDGFWPASSCFAVSFFLGGGYLFSIWAVICFAQELSYGQVTGTEAKFLW